MVNVMQTFPFDMVNFRKINVASLLSNSNILLAINHSIKRKVLSPTSAT